MNNYHTTNDKILKSNPKASYLFAPMQGPLKNAHITREEQFKPTKNVLTGYAETHLMDDFTFNEQYHTYQSFGYALDPSKGVSTNCINKQSFIGDKESLKKNKAMTVFNQSNKVIKKKKKERITKRKRAKSGIYYIFVSVYFCFSFFYIYIVFGMFLQYILI